MWTRRWLPGPDEKFSASPLGEVFQSSFTSWSLKPLD